MITKARSGANLRLGLRRSSMLISSDIRNEQFAIPDVVLVPAELGHREEHARLGDLIPHLVDRCFSSSASSAHACTQTIPTDFNKVAHAQREELIVSTRMLETHRTENVLMKHEPFQFRIPVQRRGCWVRLESCGRCPGDRSGRCVTLLSHAESSSGCCMGL